MADPTRDDVLQALTGAVAALQAWYGADTYAARTGLYSWLDTWENFAKKAGWIPTGLGVDTHPDDTDFAFAAYSVMKRWWNSANALTALINYMLLTNDRSYFDKVDYTFTNAQNAWIPDQNAAKSGNLQPIVYSGFLNKYYDDASWWALTWIRAFDLTRDRKYLDMSATIFWNIINSGGWDTTCNGGIYWQRRDADNSGNAPYKNAISSELFIALAGALYLRYAPLPSSYEPGAALPAIVPAGVYRGWALRGWDWFRNTSGLINQNGFVNDGLDTECNNNGQPVWSYNHGVILGGLADLAQITGDSTYLDAAEQIADALLQNPVKVEISGVDENGILTEWNELESIPSPDTDVDHAQFKGIFVRNLAYLYSCRPNPRYRTFLVKNAAAALQPENTNAAHQYGCRWDRPIDTADFVRQTSAVDLLNAALLALTGP